MHCCQINLIYSIIDSFIMSIDQTSVTAIMAKNVELASDDQNIQNICQKMYEKKIGSIIIVEEELFNESENISFERKEDNLLYTAGIITERDIVRFLGSGSILKFSLAGEIMSKPLITINSTNSIKDALEYMNLKNIKRLPILDSNDHIIGIISFTDIVRYLIQTINQSPLLIENQIPLYDESFINKLNEVWSHDYLPF